MTIRVIMGPPCSGKTTRARAMGVEVVDLDDIEESMGGVRYARVSPVRDAARVERRRRIEEIVESGRDAVVIDTAPSDERIAEYRAAGAVFEVMDPGRHEAVARADGRPDGTVAVINQWYDEHADRLHTQAKPPSGGFFDARMGDPTTRMGVKMSDEQAPETPDAEGADKPEIDWKAEARKHEQRSKENYQRAKDNEAAAQRLAELEAANLTESEKQAEALAQAQKQLEELTRAKTRAEVAAAKQIPADLLAGSTQEELEASAEALIAWRGSVAPARPTIDPVPASGTGGGSQGKSVDGNALYERATGKGR